MGKSHRTFLHPQFSRCRSIVFHAWAHPRSMKYKTTSGKIAPGLRVCGPGYGIYALEQCGSVFSLFSFKGRMIYLQQWFSPLAAPSNHLRSSAPMASNFIGLRCSLAVGIFRSSIDNSELQPGYEPLTTSYLHVGFTIKWILRPFAFPPPLFEGDFKATLKERVVNPAIEKLYIIKKKKSFIAKLLVWPFLSQDLGEVPAINIKMQFPRITWN